MAKAQPILQWTLIRLANMQRQLRAAQTKPQRVRLEAAESALQHLAAVVEELAKHLDLVEQETAPWMPLSTSALQQQVDTLDRTMLTVVDTAREHANRIANLEQGRL